MSCPTKCSSTVPGTTVSDGVVWTIEVTLGESNYPVTGGKITPDRAGEYTVTYTAAYNGSEYSATATLTVERTAAEANEIESFNDPVSLDSVRLESGDNFAETYLPAGERSSSRRCKGRCVLCDRRSGRRQLAQPSFLVLPHDGGCDPEL